MAWHGTARHGMTWHGTARHDMAWHDIVNLNVYDNM